MALVSFASFRHFRSELFFIVLCLLTWLTLFQCIEGARMLPASVLLLFACGAGIASMISLKLFGAPSPIRLTPRRSDFLAVLIAFSLGGLVQHFLIGSLLGVAVCTLIDILTWSPILAAVTFGMYYAGMHAAHVLGHRRKVVLDLLPGEDLELRGELRQQGMESCFVFLSRAGLGQSMLRGRGGEIELIVISRAALQEFHCDALLLRAHLEGIPIVDIQSLLADLTGRVSLASSDFWGYLTAATPQTPLLRVFWRAKILTEPLVALLLGAALLPVLLMIAVLVKFSGRGPVLYRQVRTGYLGRNFTMLKFRSMREDAESGGPQWSSPDDSRVTTVGYWLRRTRLDELPQLWNVLRGEMSFFGPRPERPEIYHHLKREIPLFSVRTVVRPGITGWAQVCAGYAASVDQSRRKLEYDLYYIQHMSPRLDFIIFIKTITLLFFGNSVAERARSPREANRIAELSVS